MIKTASTTALGLITSLLIVTPALAEPSPADKAASRIIFNEARSLMDTGHVNEACPKFLESQRLYPSVSTLLNLGDCYEKASPSQTASAWGAFIQAETAARTAGDKDRQEEATRRAKALEGRLSKLVITVAPSNQAGIIEVRRDGQVIGQALWGSAIPVDPGEHTIEATAPGKRPWAEKAVVPDKPGNMTVTVSLLEPTAVVPDKVIKAEEVPWWNTQRKVGVAIGATGIAGVIVGGVFGALVGSKKSGSVDQCRPAQPNVCSQQGVDLRNTAYAYANVSNVAFAVGGAAVVGGVVLFLTAPPGGTTRTSKPTQLELGSMGQLGSAGFMLRGEW